jgi:hypothetical protein
LLFFLDTLGPLPYQRSVHVSSKRINGIPSCLSTEACRTVFWRSRFARRRAILTGRWRDRRWDYMASRWVLGGGWVQKLQMQRAMEKDWARASRRSVLGANPRRSTHESISKRTDILPLKWVRRQQRLGDTRFCDMLALC